MDHIWFMHPAFHRCWSCIPFWLFWIVNNATVNLGVQNLFRCLHSVLFGVYPEVELLGQLVILCLISKGITISISTEATYNIHYIYTCIHYYYLNTVLIFFRLMWSHSIIQEFGFLQVCKKVFPCLYLRVLTHLNAFVVFHNLSKPYKSKAHILGSYHHRVILSISSSHPASPNNVPCQF